MGVCLSCLGLDRRGGNRDTDESTALLLPENNGYGGVDGYGAPGQLPALDPIEVQREREALLRIVENAGAQYIHIFGVGGVPGHPGVPGMSGGGGITSPQIMVSKDEDDMLGEDEEMLESEDETIMSLARRSRQSGRLSQRPDSSSSTGLNNPHHNSNQPYNQRPARQVEDQLAEYRRLMEIALADPETNIPADPIILPPSTVTKKEREWLAELSRDCEVALAKMVEVNTKGVGPLVGRFDDFPDVSRRR